MANPTTVEEYLAMPKLKKRLETHRAELEVEAKKYIDSTTGPEAVARVEDYRSRKEKIETKKAASEIGSQKYFVFRRGEIIEKVRSNA